MTTYPWVILSLMLVAVPVTAFAQPTYTTSVPPEFVTYKALGDAYLAAGLEDDALKHYGIALGYYDDPIVAGEAGILWLKRGVFDVAASHLSRAVNDAGSGLSKEERAKFSDKYSDALREVCRVHVAVDQSKAAIEVDGRIRAQGRTDFNVFLNPGEHTIRARLAGFVEASETIVTHRGCERPVSFVLTPLPPPRAKQETLDWGAKEPPLYGDEPPTNPLKRSLESKFLAGVGVWIPFGVAPGFALGAQVDVAWQALPWLSIGAELRGGTTLYSRDFAPFTNYVWAGLAGVCARRVGTLVRGRYLLCAHALVYGGGMSIPGAGWHSFGVNLRAGYEFHLTSRVFLGTFFGGSLLSGTPTYEFHKVFWQGSWGSPELGINIVRFF